MLGAAREICKISFLIIILHKMFLVSWLHMKNLKGYATINSGISAVIQYLDIAARNVTL